MKTYIELLTDSDGFYSGSVVPLSYNTNTYVADTFQAHLHLNSMPNSELPVVILFSDTERIAFVH